MTQATPRYHDLWDLDAFIWDGSYNSIYGELWTQNEEEGHGLLPEDLEKEATYIFDAWDHTYTEVPTIQIPNGTGWTWATL